MLHDPRIKGEVCEVCGPRRSRLSITITPRLRLLLAEAVHAARDASGNHPLCKADWMAADAVLAALEANHD